MTIALAIRVNHGIVLAADSASTVFRRIVDPATGQSQMSVVQVYNNANKVFRLVKGLPIGVCTWGSGTIGAHPVELLIRELGQRLSTRRSGSDTSFVDKDNYSISAVAASLRRFIFEEHYLKEFPTQADRPPLGFLVGGYSSDKRLPEMSLIQVLPDGTIPAPVDQPNVFYADGAPEAILRLCYGFNPDDVGNALLSVGVPPPQVGQALNVIASFSVRSLFYEGMPLQDGIDLAEFLVDLTVKYQRFLPGAKTVGGPIEIAAITKYDGFKWVKHKHYYTRELNPVE